MNLQPYIDSSRDILVRAIGEHRPSHVFALFSGGHDSLVSTHVAKSLVRVDAAVHINTTIGIKKTREYVRRTAPALGLPLIELYPPVSYRDICLEHGMPGPGAHLYCYTRLKERCIEQLVREHKVARHDRIMLITGVRKHESGRRKMNVTSDIDRRGAQLWVSGCMEWTGEAKEAYIEQCGLPRNPVVEEIGMSGECMCGSFGDPSELVIVAEAFPDMKAEIDDLQQACAERGVHAQWGVRPPNIDRYSLTLPGVPDRPTPMCVNCDRRRA